MINVKWNLILICLIVGACVVLALLFWFHHVYCKHKENITTATVSEEEEKEEEERYHTPSPPSLSSQYQENGLPLIPEKLQTLVDMPQSNLSDTTSSSDTPSGEAVCPQASKNNGITYPNTTSCSYIEPSPLPSPSRTLYYFERSLCEAADSRRSLPLYPGSSSSKAPYVPQENTYETSLSSRTTTYFSESSAVCSTEEPTPSYVETVHHKFKQSKETFF